VESLPSNTTRLLAGQPRYTVITWALCLQDMIALIVINPGDDDNDVDDVNSIK